MTLKITHIAVVFAATLSVAIHSADPLSTWNSLLKSNEKFVKNNSFIKQRTQLKDKQNPPVIVLGCSDSRVSPELIFDKQLGSLFVVRVAGHVADDVAIDSIEYAVTHFQVGVIVVLGHSGCGAVTGALKHLQENGGMLDQPNEYLGAVLIPIEKAITEAHINIQSPQALEESIKTNIQYVAHQLTARSSIIREAVDKGQLVIVGAEYFLSSGKVKQLFVMQQKVVKKKSK